MAFFMISDTHFAHENIKQYEPVRENISDDMMIERWNDVVEAFDDVWHLGDFAFKSQGWNAINKLNGNITLLKGNHDFKKRNDYLSKLGFHRIIDAIVLDIAEKEKALIDEKLNHCFSKELLSSCVCWIGELNGKRVLLSHYPCFYEDPYASVLENERKRVLEALFDWCGCALNFHGHIHSKISGDARLVNVSVEHIGFTPLKIF